MSETNPNRSNRLVVILGLTMALGPLTALSLGSKFAPEETWERAQAGLENAEPENVLGQYESGAPYASERSLREVMAGSGVFDGFTQVMSASGREDLLSGPDSYTIFVPSDEAFARLPADERQALMSDQEALGAWVDRHIVPGRYTATDLMQMGQARTLGGNSIDVGASAKLNGQVGIGDAAIVKSNIIARNGIVHVIDTAL